MKIAARFSAICLLLTVSLCSFDVRAQDLSRPPELWLARAQTMTDDLIRDAATQTEPDRALLWGRLGKAWWVEDPVRARTWFKKAVQEVESPSDHESATKRRQRFSIARALMNIIAPHDKTLGTQLASLFESDVERATTKERGENAQALIDAALAVLDSNPKQAAELGSASLRIGRSYRLASLLWRLRSRDAKLGDVLFIETLMLARTTYEKDLLDALTSVAFRGPVPSDELRMKVLSILAEGLLRVPTSTGGEGEICKLAPTASLYLEQYNRLAPQQAPIVRQALTRCQSGLKSSARQSVDEALRDQPLKSIADLESEADKAASQELRDDYLIRATGMAAEQKNFEQAISLLDRISDAGRKQLGGGWEGWRWEYASLAALAQLKRGDRPAMYRIIAATPADLRGLVQIAVAPELGKLGEPSSAIELLNDARQRLAQSSEAEVIDGYFSLVRHYETLIPIDALNVFNEAVKALNRPEKGDPTADQTLDAATSLLSNDLLLAPYNVPVALLERDEQGLRAAISSIESPSKRAAIRLNLLSSALARHRASTPVNKPAMSKAGRPVEQ
jgi:hypothetical protein